uniref:Complement C1q-like protein 3 n=1 Tax=Crassostrea virginica TaxID=6565 RepID=A0A8B8BEN0_CRAVI|nr:complement C1q-like protein 3 [Crassostrea virginica]
MRYYLVFAFPICGWILTQTVQTANPADFLKDIKEYKDVCRSLECTTDKRNVIAFHANLRNTIKNIPKNTVLKFDDVKLNEGKGYDPKTGIFTVPTDGVYSFAWSLVSINGGTVDVAAVVDNVALVKTCVYKQQSNYLSISGHLLSKLKKGNKVWLKTFWTAATHIHSDGYTYFSGNQIR